MGVGINETSHMTTDRDTPAPARRASSGAASRRDQRGQLLGVTPEDPTTGSDLDVLHQRPCAVLFPAPSVADSDGVVQT
ncbi:MAG: hypothetical protein ACRDNS_24660 [Trebonia sp.]